IQNGVDLSEVDAYRKLDASIEPRSANGKRIGFVGQMIPRKAVEELLLTFDDLWQEDPSLTLNLLGDGSERQSLEDLAQTLESASNIHFLGFRLDRLDQMRTFDLFAMTSTLEGIPRCLMEAMAMELPVAAYNIPGVDQLIEHEKTGLLASPGDRKALKSHWKKLLTDDEYARDIATAGRKFVNEKYSGARMANEYTELFSCLVNGQLPYTYQSGA
ncbi:MAG: glycosyltransferase, partial [Pseudomonadales bacterium]